MTKFRDMFKKVFKETTLREVEYDPIHDEYYYGPNEAHARNENTYTTLKFTLKGHDALLKAMQEIGYTKEHDYDAIYIENGEAYILIEDAFVDYDTDVDAGEEYVSTINSVSAPAVIPMSNPDEGYRVDPDHPVDITDKLLPEDLEYIRNKLNEEVELVTPDYEAELTRDYYDSVL